MIVTNRLNLNTKGNNDVIDITHDVIQSLAETDLANGLATVFVAGSTAGVTTIETEPGLVNDFKGLWDRLVPRDIHYQHDSGEGNGFAHLRASLLGPSLTIPFDDGRLALGTWQQVVVVDFDNRPRTRPVIIQVSGEKGPEGDI